MRGLEPFETAEISSIKKSPGSSRCTISPDQARHPFQDREPLQKFSESEEYRNLFEETTTIQAHPSSRYSKSLYTSRALPQKGSNELTEVNICDTELLHKKRHFDLRKFFLKLGPYSFCPSRLHEEIKKKPTQNNVHPLSISVSERQ